MKNYLIILFSAFSILTYSQSGVSGLVMDGDYNEPLAFSNVLIKGTTKGTSTDFDGKFQIELEPGLYTVVFSYVGYDTIEISDITVTNGKFEFIEVTMNASANSLDQVVITTTAKRNSATSVLNIQKKSVNLVDGLSLQSIKKSGDSDVAGAIRRVPGVSVQNGKYVFVRGLGDRYSKTLLNGSELPGLDPDRNTLPMDIFPTNLIENILVKKSASAELGADFTGGTIDINMKDFSFSPDYSINFSGGYNPDMHFNSDFIADKRSSSDWLGKDDGYRSIPTKEDILINPLGFRPESALLPEYTNLFDKQMSSINETSGMNLSFGASASNGYELKNGDKIGFVTALGYKSEIEFYDDYVNQTIFRTSDTYEKNSLQTSQVGRKNKFLSILAGFTYKNQNSKISLNYIELRNGESTAQNFKYGEYIENIQNTVGNNITYTERKLTVTPFSFKHQSNNGNFNFNFDLTPSVSKLYDKDFKKTAFLTNVQGGEINYVIRNTSGFPTRLWRDLDENALVTKLGTSIKIDNDLFTGKLKLGASNIGKKRDFNTYTFLFQAKNVSPFDEPNPDYILLDENIWTPENNSGFYVRSNHERTARYNSKSETNAAYLSSEMKFSDFFKATLGLRLETYKLFYTGEDFDGNVYDNSKFIDVSDIYPNANLIFSLNENTNIRTAFSKTTARPTFKEASTAYLQNQIDNTIFVGNPDLKPSYIDNLDFRFERYGEGNKMIALSLFYKNFQDPIEITYVSSNSPNDFKAVNNNKAEVFGIEFEARQNIFETERNVLSFNTNLTYIKAKQYLSDLEYDYRKSIAEVLGIDEVKRYRDLQGQSPYMINAGLIFAKPEQRFETGVFFNVQGETLEIVGTGGQIPDVYTQPFENLDLTISKVFGDSKFEKKLTFRAQNLLDATRESLYQQDGMQDFVFRSFKPGTRFTLGLSMKF